MTVEIIPPGQSLSPGPEVTLQQAVEELIIAAGKATGHIALYQPRADLSQAIHVATTVLAREQALKKIPTVVELPKD